MDCLVFLLDEQRFVAGGVVDQSFIDAGIVNRGCAALSCLSGPVDGARESVQ